MSILFAFALLTSEAAPESGPPSFYESLRAADRRLASIGHRLATANAPLCDRLQPAGGIVVHALAQYGGGEREKVRRAFGFEEPVTVEAVTPGGPAEIAGVRADDALVAVNGKAVQEGGTGTADRDRALDLMEAGAPTAPVTLTLRRGRVDRTVAVPAVPACRARFELLLGRGAYAGADGRVVKLGERFFERYSDEEIAVVVAHELAHVILRHADRLDAAGVDRGLLKEFGRSGRLFRRTEREADELGVHLLANAGYDPMASARFWRTRGGEIDHGVLRSRTHDSSRERAETAEAVARSLAGRALPVRPDALLSTRDQPLSRSSTGAAPIPRQTEPVSASAAGARLRPECLRRTVALDRAIIATSEARVRRPGTQH